MINIKSSKSVVIAETKDGEIREFQYFDENGNRVFPKEGVEYNVMGSVMTYPFNN